MPAFREILSGLWSLTMGCGGVGDEMPASTAQGKAGSSSTEDPRPSSSAGNITAPSCLQDQGNYAEFVSQNPCFDPKVMSEYLSKATKIRHFPIAFHVVRPEGGEGRFNRGTAIRGLEQLNRSFLPSGIQFYAQSFDTIPSDALYLNSCFSREEGRFCSEQESLLSSRIVSSAINVFFVPVLDGIHGQLQCLESEPARPADRMVFVAQDFPFEIEETLIHEMGHFFGLKHTYPDILENIEALDNSESRSKGDHLRDTPPEMNAAFCKDPEKGDVSLEHCPKDPQGKAYEQLGSLNFMSRGEGRRFFSQEQFAVMACVAEWHEHSISSDSPEAFDWKLPAVGCGGSSYPSISEALKSLPLNGEPLEICPGAYSESIAASAASTKNTEGIPALWIRKKADSAGEVHIKALEGQRSFVVTDLELRLDDLRLSGGQAELGAGIYQQGGNQYLNRLILQGHQASLKGGAIYFSGGSAHWDEIQFLENSAKLGAGFYLAAELSRLNAIRMEGNQGESSLAIWQGGNHLVSSVTLINNEVPAQGHLWTLYDNDGAGIGMSTVGLAASGNSGKALALYLGQEPAFQWDEFPKESFFCASQLQSCFEKTSP